MWLSLVLVLSFGSLAICQLENGSNLRAGLRWLANEAQKSQIESNSVHKESLLRSPVKFWSASVKRTLVATGRKESENYSKLHKRTNLIEVAKSLNLTIFLQKVKEAGIDDVLDHEGQFTVFAPTDEAFARIPKFCSDLKVKDLMRFHVSKGAMASTSFKNNLILKSLLTHRGTRINMYKNGTVATANGRNINQTDFKASNGILHILDDVMCAVYRGSPVFAINRCPKLTTLAKVVNLTGIYKDLDRAKLLTMFAPTDDAFAKLPLEVMNELLKNMTALKEVLFYHVVPEVWYKAGFENGLMLTTLQGQNVTIGVGDTVTVDEGTVVAADATARNGVVHGIDTVLIPIAIRGMIDFDIAQTMLLN